MKCKGKRLCGRSFCPLQAKYASQKKSNRLLKQDYSGDAPNVFVGEYGYPNVRVGILNTEEDKHHDDVSYWKEKEYGIPKIIDLRTQLINSVFKANVKNFNNRFLELSQEISMSEKPVDVEVNLERKPQFRLSFNQDVKPHGPNVDLRKIELEENVRVPRKVDKVVSDTDFKAQKGIEELYKNGFNEHYLTKLISVGNLGVKMQRRLVPTRRSITAVDDIIAKKIVEEVKSFEHHGYRAFFGGYLGNYYLILVFDDVFRYELFETVIGERISFATDYENYKGRKSYAFNTAGGYYACRLGVLEKLKEMKLQGSVLALRFINPKEYVAPLGVFVCREGTRNSMVSKPISFSSKELMILYAKHFVKKKFGVELDMLLRKSKLLKELKEQKKLVEF